MELKNIFNGWAQYLDKQYAHKQWLLSKWEVAEGIEWPQEKIDVMLQHILDGLDLKDTDTILDLGCGGGWITKALEAQTKNLIGLDISFEMLRYAVDLCSHAQFVCSEAARLAFKNDTFERVLSYFVFININDEDYVEQSLKEIYRVLKKGGCALIGQIPDKECSSDYDCAKKDYLEYCKKTFSIGKNHRDNHFVPVHLFDRCSVMNFLRQEKISYQIRNSFNPFYREGQPQTVRWRFDIIIKK
jgi:ubiquinone/menaquinone biosynthesis C-methylase UbiE